jgi:putative nucleotidyltransferase with HDIG domain
LILSLAGLEVLIGAAVSLETNARADARLQKASRVLVVDSEAHVRAMICATLESQGYQVQVISCGREALKMVKESDFDLVLTEVVIQDGSGISLMELIREQQPQLPVVMVTAIHDISVAIDAMHRGAYDYVLKPFERDRLLGTVQHALEYRQTLQENHSYQQNLEMAVRARTELLRQAMEDIEQSYDITLEALGDALDLKDSETEGHSKRVTAYTIALARAMGAAATEIKVIARGAFLHDIGKMALSDEILRKPGPLNEQEQTFMRRHCASGYDMLRKIPFLREAAEIVFTHQEHYDGGGYPSGLRGTEIPIGARIFAIADALDAITSERPYRKARSFEDACKEIQRCSGTQFDPTVVEVFLKVPIEVWQELRTQIGEQSKRLSTFDIVNRPILKEK